MQKEELVFTGGTVEETDTVIARRAVSEFKRMLPALNGYARSLTGRKDVSVVMSRTSNGMTDGKVIFMRPPSDLGRYRRHTRSKCNKRDASRRQQRRSEP